MQTELVQSPARLWAFRREDAADRQQPTCPGHEPGLQETGVWSVVVSQTNSSATMTLEAPKKLMTRSTIGEDFPAVYLTVGTVGLFGRAARRFYAQK